MGGLGPLREPVQDNVDPQQGQAVSHVGSREGEVGHQQANIQKGIAHPQFEHHQASGDSHRYPERDPVDPWQGEEEDEQGRYRAAKGGYAWQVDPGNQIPGRVPADRLGVLGDPEQRHRERDRAHGHVDPEHRPPVEPSDQHPADRGTDREGSGTGGRESPEYATGRLAQSDGGGAPPDQQHGRRVPSRRPQPDEHPSDDQGRNVPSKTADNARDENYDDAHQEHAPRAELLRETAGHGLGDRAGQIQTGDQDGGLPIGDVHRTRD